MRSPKEKSYFLPLWQQSISAYLFFQQFTLNFPEEMETHPPQAIIPSRQIRPFQYRVSHASMELLRSGKYAYFLAYHLFKYSYHTFKHVYVYAGASLAPFYLIHSYWFNIIQFWWDFTVTYKTSIINKIIIMLPSLQDNNQRKFTLAHCSFSISS